MKLPNGLTESACKKSVALLNQTLADTMTLRGMYKKHRWQGVGPTFDQLHLLFDNHHEAQAELVDIVAARKNAETVSDTGDSGTNDVLVSNVLRGALRPGLGRGCIRTTWLTAFRIRSASRCARADAAVQHHQNIGWHAKCNGSGSNPLPH